MPPYCSPKGSESNWLHPGAAPQARRGYYFGIFNWEFLKHKVKPYLCFIVLVTEMGLVSQCTLLKLHALTELPRPSDSLMFFFPPLTQVKTDVVKEVAAARRKQHLSSLQYYCALNALQYRKRVAMMEPMIGFAHGQVGHALPLKPEI